MPCHSFRLPTGEAGIICTPRSRRSRCRFCKAYVADRDMRLCDEKKPRGGTCDAPCCASCATHVGENVDLCPDHAKTNTGFALR